MFAAKADFVTADTSALANMANTRFGVNTALVMPTFIL